MRRPVMLLLALCAALACATLPAVAGAAARPKAHASVVGGRNAGPTEVPWQVLVLIRSGLSMYQCGGTILDATHVLTAAHCVSDLPGQPSVSAPSDVIVVAGITDDTDLQSLPASAQDPAVTAA